MEWLWLEILVIVALVAFFTALIATYIYKKIHHIPTGDCAYCHQNKKKILKQYHKMYPHK